MHHPCLYMLFARCANAHVSHRCARTWSSILRTVYTSSTRTLCAVRLTGLCSFTVDMGDSNYSI